MSKLQYFILFILVVQAWAINASDLSISNVRGVHRNGVLDTPASVIFDINWKNSWKNDRNHDAVWVFMKFNASWLNHVKLIPEGHQILKIRSGEQSIPIIRVADDSLGFYIYPSMTYRGDINLKLQILLDTSTQTIDSRKMTGLTVHGLEMVYIPEGPFTIGSPDKSSIKRAAFYKSNGHGEYAGLFSVKSEAKINIAPKTDSLYYWSERVVYNGDQKGPIPDEFPKGFRAFYLMKYELTQGQYVDFLNLIPPGWTYDRVPIGGKDYEEKRGGIKLKNGMYHADNPSRPMNFISFTDGLAYSDWAALRPITELEYEKAARGPAEPIPAEFVWGTNNYDQLERYISEKGELITNGYDENQLSNVTRAIFGASYYWVMDLSGSLWEKVITVGNPIGRKFQGSHGDGILVFAKATNKDWPASDDEVGGFGYRGGGYYEIGTGYSDFNPHSPVGYRYYGSWSGGPRSIAYGYRAGRTADQ